MHIGFAIKSWIVELHGTLRSDLGKRIDTELDSLQKKTFNNELFRVWEHERTKIYLPNSDEDVIFVFIHILQHFFQGGVGLRQICDWCRLLWKNHQEIDVTMLEYRLYAMGVVREWKAFAAMTVKYLGMPMESMPLYSTDRCWERKGDRIFSLIMKMGNFGNARDYNYREKYPFWVSKLISFCVKTWDCVRLVFVSPQETIVVWCIMVKKGIRALVR